MRAGCFRFGRNADLKKTSPGRVFFSPDPAVMGVDDASADGEAQTGAALIARVRGVDLLEALEDGFELVGRDASTLVG